MPDRNLDVRLRVRNQRAFNSDLKKSEKGIKQVSTATGRAQLRARAGAKALGGLGGALRAVGRAGLYAGGVLLAGGGVIGKRSIDEWREAGKVNRTTAARIRSTGKAAGLSQKQIAAMSMDLSNLAAVDDEEIQRTANRLLTFTDIKGDMFKPALQAAIDMGAEFGDSGAKAIMLGKALQDPAKGATALRRAGVNLNEQQQDQLKTWVENGETIKAQKWILRELNTEFGGTAAAQADAVDRIKVAWENTEEAIGGVIGPPAMRVLDTFSKRLIDLQPEINKVGDRMADIWDPKHDRSFAQNLTLSRRVIRKELGPVWDDVKGDIDRANLDDKLIAAFGAAIPVMAREAGQGGGKVAIAFAKGWWDADLGGKLFTLALLGGKLGAFAPLGRRAAGKFSSTFARRTGESLVAQQAVDQIMGSSIAGKGARWGKLGKTAGRAFGIAFAIGAGVALHDWLKDMPKFEQYSGKKGWGELKNDVLDWLPGEDSEAKRAREERENRAMNRRLRRDPGVRHGPRTPWPGPLRAPSPGRRPTAGTSRRVAARQLDSTDGVIRVINENRLFLDGKEIAASTGRHTADRRARK